ncbi:recombinase family protein [Janthinobacterium sp. SUN120]|uniref:recombinase family protein n=1 Tax=Janthinobacterium sp. SUN120 TaxID=3004099 RepID=UPI0025B14CFB|nr:recombinase family protein [Janthinobacterium sp. SUN120]MDN2715969.1 recombinase family protein [Janthinobacterium sp. SUN120]
MTVAAFTSSARVISYLRFSSWRQRAGDSFRRQTEMAVLYCAKHRLTLDTDFVLQDLGISGFSGKNIREGGALFALQKLVVAGSIAPGTVLLVEAFDRLTRLSLPEAYELLLSLINRGLIIVTLTDEKIWTKASMGDMSNFMLSCATLYRGYHESAQKSDRLRKTFGAARKAGVQAAFGSAPGWLYRESKATPWQVHEHLAAVVNEVFELSAAGLGSKAIAAVANAAAWPVPTRLNQTEGRWHAQMAGNLLRNRAVLGEHEHRIRNHEMHAQHWKGASTGTVIPDYYPRIVSDDLWYRARASIDTRSVPKRRDAHYFNIWSGLLFCGHCGAPLQRKTEKDGHSKAQIVCSDRLAGITQCKSFSANRFDATLLHQIYMHSPAHLYKDEGLTDAIVVLESQLRETVAESDRIAKAVSKTSGRVDALLRLSMTLDEQIRDISSQLNSKREAQALAASDIAFDATFYGHCMSNLYTISDESRVVRSALNVKLSRLVKTVWVWGYDLATVQFATDNTIFHIPLPKKQLPSRAKPSSRPEPVLEVGPVLHPDVDPARRIEFGPAFSAAILGELVPPVPRRKVFRFSRTTPAYLYDSSDERITDPSSIIG